MSLAKLSLPELGLAELGLAELSLALLTLDELSLAELSSAEFEMRYGFVFARGSMVEKLKYVVPGLGIRGIRGRDWGGQGSGEEDEFKDQPRLIKNNEKCHKEP